MKEIHGGMKINWHIHEEKNQLGLPDLDQFL